MARARGAPALGLNGTPNRRPQILCCEIVFNSPRQMYFTPHSPLQMFHTPSFSPTFCCGIEFKTLQMYQEPAPIHVVALVLQKRRSEGWGGNPLIWDHLDTVQWTASHPLRKDNFPCKGWALFWPTKQHHHCKTTMHLPYLKMLLHYSSNCEEHATRLQWYCTVVHQPNLQVSHFIQ